MAAFESRRTDIAGRTGRLPVPGFDRPIDTPALLPVINPNIDTLPAAEIVEEFDPAALITNAYVIYRSATLRERALTDGVHDLLEVGCPIMTDSGSFQLAEYGQIDVDNEEIVRFQAAIGSNIVTPIDVPTPPDVTRERVISDLSTTHRRIDRARELVGDDRLLTGPVQGSTFPSIRRRAGHRVRASGVDVVPIGAVVPLMEAYRFATLVDVVVAAKRGLGSAPPIHLFGAGHPMMFALAVAMGCDLFDSAAYALFARDGRYMTTGGTLLLKDLDELPCTCPVCAETTANDLQAAEARQRERAIARHNLHVSFGELRRIRQAIRDGALFELIERRARGHPAMLAAYRRLLDHDTFLERSDPTEKGTFMYLSTESAHRPTVSRHHRRLREWTPRADIFLAEGETGTPQGEGERWLVRPPFGPVPPGLEHTYPLNAELPTTPDEIAYARAAAGIDALASGADEVSITLEATGWPATVLEQLPPTVNVVSTD